MDLSIKIGYLSIRNPLLIASGILGSSSLLAKRVFNEGAGGIVIFASTTMMAVLMAVNIAVAV